MQTIHWLKNRIWLLVSTIAAFPILVFIWRRSLHTIFFAITADDFHRTLYAWQVTQGELFPSDLWPPLQFWVEGLALLVYPYILSVPYLVNLAASTGALIFLACLGQELSLDRSGVLLAVILAATTPWFIWLSISGMGEPIFVACIILAYFGAIRWRRTGQEPALWLASLGLLGAGMVRFDAWGHSLAFSLVIVWLWWRERAPRSHRWLLAACLPWIFPVFWLIFQYLKFQTPFWFSQVTRDYWLFTNEPLPIGVRLLWQPKDLWQVGGIIVPLGLAGWWYARKRQGISLLSLMWLSSLALLIFSTLNHTITQARPERLVLIHVLLLCPLAALLLQRVSRRRKVFAFGVAFLVVALTIPRLASLPDYPNGLPQDTAQVGREINQLRAEGKIRSGERIMIEVLHWDYLILHVLTGDPGAVIYDRSPQLVRQPNGEYALDEIDNPSALIMAPDRLQTALAQHRVRIVVAFSSQAVDHLRFLGQETLSVGRFHVFVIDRVKEM